MITKEKFDFIKEKYGHFASWAIWAHEDEKPKSNMGDLTVLDPEINKNLLSQLNTNVILVALNFSKGSIDKPFGNFHSDHSNASDYKTRFALRDSIFWGGYMTDIIKDFDEKESMKLVEYLKKNKKFLQSNIEYFKQELKDIGAENPLIIAFGNAVYSILKNNLPELKIVKISHYAHYMSKEKYREEVKNLGNNHGPN